MCRGSSSLLLFTGIVILQAEIAQLVEHNLAKVGVAGPSPVFRSIIFVLNQDRFKFRAQVAELVDAHVSGACVSQRAGSSPVLGTLFVKRASFAEIAQLVEHNLAKVRVASSSLVFRSFLCFVKETEIPASFMLAGIFYFRIYSFFKANPSIIPS